MSEEKQTVLEQFGQRHLCPHNHPAACRSLYGIEWIHPLLGCCMFATGLITEDSENRVCSIPISGFCPATVFKEPKVFKSCPSRAETKKEQR